MKAAGVGLSEAFDHPEVILPLDSHHNPRKVGTVELSGSWSLFEFEPEDEFVAAVVVEGLPCRFRFWDWSRKAMAEPGSFGL